MHGIYLILFLSETSLIDLILFLNSLIDFTITKSPSAQEVYCVNSLYSCHIFAYGMCTFLMGRIYSSLKEP